MRENPVDASTEMERVVGKKYAVRLHKTKVRKRFKRGHTSRMAIIVKIKDDGSKKVRSIVDLKRGGANAAAVVLERVVLPRLGDAGWMLVNFS